MELEAFWHDNDPQPKKRSLLIDAKLERAYQLAAQIASEHGWLQHFALPTDGQLAVHEWYADQDQEIYASSKPANIQYNPTFSIHTRNGSHNVFSAEKPGISTVIRLECSLPLPKRQYGILLTFTVDTTFSRICKAHMQIVSGFAPWDPCVSLTLYPNRIETISSINIQQLLPLITKLTLSSSIRVASLISEGNLMPNPTILKTTKDCSEYISSML
jgi:hypothetical protein